MVAKIGGEKLSVYSSNIELYSPMSSDFSEMTSLQKCRLSMS